MLKPSDNIIDMLLALPYGIAADRFGRRPILLLFIVGYILGDTWVKLVCESRLNLSTTAIYRKAMV